MQICEICLKPFKDKCQTESCVQNLFELQIGARVLKKKADHQRELESNMDNVTFRDEFLSGIKLTAPKVEYIKAKKTKLIQSRCAICMKPFESYFKIRMQITCSGRCGDIYRSRTIKENNIK